MHSDKNNKPNVFMIDSIGEHRGMHYYSFALVSALNNIGTGVILISTTETAAHSLRPNNVPVRCGFKGIYSNRSKWVRGLQYALSLLRIAWWSWRDSPKSVHFHFFQIPLLDLLLLCWLRLLGVRVIVTVHDTLPFTLGEDIAPELGKIYHRLYSISSGLIIHSQHARDSLARLDSQLLTKATLIPQGGYLNISQRNSIMGQDAKTKIGLKPSKPVILVFGTIKANKRLDLVIEAMTRVNQSFPTAKLVVVGKPWEQDVSMYIELADQLGLNPPVLWRLDYVTDKELGWYFSAADVVVFPYQWIYQSAALVMAMSFGKPVVATSVGSNVEIIQHNRTGILVPLDAPDAMADAIQTILSDKELASEMGRAAYEYVTTELSWDNIARLTVSFYNQSQHS